MTFHVVRGKLEFLSCSIVCQLHDGERAVICTVSRRVLRDLADYHQLHVSDEAAFSHLLPVIERLANECIRAGRVDENGNVTIGTTELVRYGLAGS